MMDRQRKGRRETALFKIKLSYTFQRSEFFQKPTISLLLPPHCELGGHMKPLPKWNLDCKSEEISDEI